MARQHVRVKRMTMALIWIPAVLFVWLLLEEGRWTKQTWRAHDAVVHLISGINSTALVDEMHRGPLFDMKWMKEVLQIRVGDTHSWRFCGASRDYDFYRISYPVAVKIFKNDRKIQEDALHEIQLSACLRHDGLVQFLGLVENTTDTSSDSEFNLPGYVMEYFPGKQLESLLDELNPRHRDPVPLGQRIKIALQISEALAYLHSKRIAHFDVKPEQILIRFSSHSRTRRVARTLAQILFPEDSDHLLACPDCDVSARLIDYGTALRFAKDSPYINARLENGKRWRGTHHYLAPEMVLNDQYVTKSVDVYAFGVILWEMFTRSYPYRETKMKLVIQAIERLEPVGLVIPKDCEPEWRELIMNCMEWRPEDRPTFHQISQRLQSYWQSLNDQASPRRQSASSDIPRESIAGLYRSRHSAVSSSETIETEETDVSFENVCSSRFGVIPSYDTMISDEAMSAIQREFLRFSLDQLLDGSEIKADNQSNADLCISRFIASFARKGHLDERLAREIYLHSFLRHPALVPFVGLLVTEKKGSNVVRGVLLADTASSMPSLSDYIRSNPPLSRRAIVELFRQLIDLLIYLDAHNVSLTNLNPENVFIETGNQFKIQISDFSQAQCTCFDALPKCLGDDRALNRLEGALDLRFVAPEIIACGRPHGSLSDLYSACMILHLMCTNQIHSLPKITKPENWNPASELNKHFDTTRCSFAMRDLILQCIQPNPSLRSSLHSIYSWIHLSTRL